MTTTTRRSVLAGLAATAASPALAQFDSAIKPQNDPWAQVDPYADPRNGFSAPPRRLAPAGEPGRQGIFDGAGSRRFSGDEDREELALARQSFDPCQAEDGGPVANKKLQEAMAAFFKPIAAVAERQQFPWHASLARSMEINAWTVGAGLVSVNAGLIAMCDHPGELAAVLAHEAGHVDHGHILKGANLRQALAEAAKSNPGLLTDVRGAMGGGIIPQQGGVAAFQVLKAGFSRTDEFEADEHALLLMSRAGINPEWAVSMMSKLAKYGFMHGHHLLNDLIIDHPPAPERVANMKAKLSGLPRPKTDMVPSGWDALKAAIPTDPKFKGS
ncbi:exported hypothetical protein [Magnetospirillum sp. LM-5]|uniref:M48 family metallopeptidase n=1 Tax=Magnetospirillum sp. LM-5 TaxID=2681466 RepID=UPI00137D68B3|nr:M48 family metallopeptidase [Magnetospirillum sp. LM-5]CAA7618411.1 exported hypothetical protein [Magnetospirillum sp. LM-5]